MGFLCWFHSHQANSKALLMNSDTKSFNDWYNNNIFLLEAFKPIYISYPKIKCKNCFKLLTTRNGKALTECNGKIFHHSLVFLKLSPDERRRLQWSEWWHFPCHFILIQHTKRAACLLVIDAENASNHISFETNYSELYCYATAAAAAMTNIVL